jgi:hypothetical protein
MYDAEYSVILYDIKTAKKQAVIPFTSMSFSQKLCDYGEFTGNLLVNPTTALSGKLWSDVLEVGKTTLYVVRNKKIVWGGVLYSYTINQPDRKLEVTARTFEWVFNVAFQGITKKYTKTEQLTIARELVTPLVPYYAMAIDSTTTSGVKRDKSFYKYDFKTIFDSLDDLSNLINGFEWGVTVSGTSSGTITRSVDFWYKHKGKSKSSTKLSFAYPSNSIKSYKYTSTLADAATRAWTLGAGEGDEMITARADKKDMTGYPIIEESYSYKDVSKQTTLQQHANSEIKRVEAPIELLEVTVRANNSNAPTIGDFEVGDWAKFTFTDWFFNPSYSTFMRIVEYNISVDEDGLEEIDFTLNTERDETYDDESDEE